MKTLEEILLEALVRIEDIASQEGIDRVLDEPADYDGVCYLIELLDNIQHIASRAMKEAENNNG